MSRYRRSLAAGATFFFTVNTYRRKKQLIHPEVRTALREAIKRVRVSMPFTITFITTPSSMGSSGGQRNGRIRRFTGMRAMAYTRRIGAPIRVRLLETQGNKRVCVIPVQNRKPRARCAPYAGYWWSDPEVSRFPSSASKQCFQTRLLEVPIMSQGLRDSSRLHEFK